MKKQNTVIEVTKPDNIVPDFSSAFPDFSDAVGPSQKQWDSFMEEKFKPLQDFVATLPKITIPKITL